MSKRQAKTELNAETVVCISLGTLSWIILAVVAIHVDEVRELLSVLQP